MIYLAYLKLRLTRVSNMLGRGGLFRRFKAKRQGTTPRRSANIFLTVALGLLLLLSAFSMAFNSLRTIDSDYDRAAFLLMTFTSAFLMTMGSREFSRTEWDMEWLITLPISKAQLIAMRLFERTVANPVAIYLLYPTMSLLWIRYGKVGIPLGLLLGIVSVLPLAFLIAVLQTLMDTGLRVRMKASQLKNLQAVFSVLGLISFYAVMPIGGQKDVPIGVQFVDGYVTSEQSFGPFFQLVSFAAHRDALAFLNALLMIAAAGLLGVLTILWMLRQGVAANSGQVSGPRGALAPRRASGTSRGLLSPMPWKEFKLLARDRNYMVQTVGTPLLILGMQIFLRAGSLQNLKVSLPILAATAFGTASYAMLFSAFMILTSEGPALWILYTFPVRMRDLLVQKAKPWIVVAFIYWCAFAGYGLYLYSSDPLVWAAYFATALFGIAILLTLAVSLGVYSFDVSAVENVRKIKTSYMYLYMLLATSFGSVFFIDDKWNCVVGAALISMVAFAFWQKANDLLPYLLDASAAPKPVVTLADGMIAVYSFFVMQIIFSLFLNMFLAFGLAGLIVFAVTRYQYYKSGTEGVPSFRTKEYLRPLILGLGSGLICALIATVYLRAADQFGWFDGLEFEKLSEITHKDRMLYSLVAVLLAPIFEEFIFRGLIFQGLQKSLSPTLAVVISAVIFACVHPIPAVIPVMILGMFTAVLMRSQKTLFAPAVAHATYNLAIVAIGMLT